MCYRRLRSDGAISNRRAIDHSKLSILEGLATLIGNHLTRERTASPVLIKRWKSELMLATNFGTLRPKFTKVGSQNCTRLVMLCLYCLECLELDITILSIAVECRIYKPSTMGWVLEYKRHQRLKLNAELTIELNTCDLETLFARCELLIAIQHRSQISWKRHWLAEIQVYFVGYFLYHLTTESSIATSRFKHCSHTKIGHME